MAEYIEREAAIVKLCQMTDETSHDYCAGISVAVDAIDGLPAADVRPVVRGEWRLEREPDGTPYCFHCSVCDDDFSIIGITTKYNYCPNCGAKMEV